MDDCDEVEASEGIGIVRGEAVAPAWAASCVSNRW